MQRRNVTRRVGWLALLGVVGTGLGACDIDRILEVEAPGILTVEELTEPGDVPVVIGGIVGSFNRAFDNYVRYSGLFTDEFLLAGTFPTRLEVDERRVQAQNATVNDDLYEPLQAARFAADTFDVQFSQAVDDPAFASVLPDVERGIALAKLYGAYARLLLAEQFCTVAIAGQDPEPSDLMLERAIALFQQAIAAAEATDNPDIASAAQVGIARANLDLGRFDAAAAAARQVPEGFEWLVEYSSGNESLYNDVFTFTYGVTQVIRWTVGDGTSPERHFERWPFFDEWVDLGLIRPRPPGFRAFNSSIPVNLQTKYNETADDIVLASRAEADFVLAEVAIVQGGDPNIALANQIVNEYREVFGFDEVFDFADTDQLRVALAEEYDIDLGPLTDQEVQLIALTKERARTLWLTGIRQGELRRYVELYGLNLYPETPGEQICIPVPEQEIVGGT